MNVNLALLSSEVKGFFEQKGYVVELGCHSDVINIVVRVRWSPEVVRITIERSSDELTVEGFFVDERPPSCFIPSMLGGGAFLLQKLRWRESLQKLEKEFGFFVETTVKRLAGSGSG